MVSVSINFANNKEVMKRIDSLGKYLRKAMREALVPSAKAVKKEAIPNVRTRTGKTRGSLDFSTERMSAHIGSDYFALRFLEGGTSPHTIKPKHKKVLSDGNTIFGKLVMHPGHRAMPSLRPALESCRQDIQQFFFVEIDRAITKAGQA